MSVSINLKILRERKGLSQTALGDKIGLTRNQVNTYERAQARPSTEACIKLAEYFGISVKELIK